MAICTRWARMSVLAGSVVLLACTGTAPSEQPSAVTNVGSITRTVTATGGMSFVDVGARCRLLLPSSDFRIRAKHYEKANSDQVRHRITVTPAGDKSLARIDLWDNPRRLSADLWAKKHLAYLLDDEATVTSATFGTEHLDGILIVRPRSPQSFASRTVVMTNGSRVAVIDGSDVETGARRRAFEVLVSGFRLEVSP